MKTKVMDAMQSFSKALIGPVLFLPLAGMIQALSSIMCNTSIVTEGSIIYMIGTFINGGIGTVMSNLGILFCVGITMNLAKKRKADAAFVSLISYLIWLAANAKWLDVAGLMVEGSTASDLYGTGQTICLGFHVTDMGVFLGMILGVVVAVVHNRFIDTEFKGAFALYGNSKFVFIVMIPIVFVLALAAAYVWPVIAMGINALTGIMSSAGAFGVFLYGFLNRILIPTGLHHLVWSPFLWSSIGDSMIVNGELISGAKSVFLALLSDPTAPMSDSTRFLTYGLMKTFGVIGVALAFIKTAKKNKKAACKAQVIPSTLTACLVGVTEPLEFSFLFAAPVLWVVYSVMDGLFQTVVDAAQQQPPSSAPDGSAVACTAPSSSATSSSSCTSTTACAARSTSPSSAPPSLCAAAARLSAAQSRAARALLQTPQARWQTRAAHTPPPGRAPRRGGAVRQPRGAVEAAGRSRSRSSPAQRRGRALRSAAPLAERLVPHHQAAASKVTHTCAAHLVRSFVLFVVRCLFLV